MNLFTELKRRNVFKVGVAYLVMAWLLIQIADTLSDMLALPDVIGRTLLLLLLIGFPVALILSWIYEASPQGLVAQESVDAGAPRSSGRKLNAVIVGGLTLALAFVVLDAYVLNDTQNSPEPAAVTADEAPQSDNDVASAAAAADPEKSIAVLPFTNLSSDPEQDYFSDGLAEEILNKLAQVNGLQVVARTSSFYFKGRNEDMRTIGEALDVGHILEGSVRKSGTQLRITAQLINAQTGYHLWSDTFDSSLEDVFAIQDEIAAAVATALSISLGAGEFDLPGMTRNVEAYDAYLKADAAFNEIGIAAINSAIESLQRAVAIDPEFGLGWLALAGTYENGRILLPADQVADALNSAREAREQARRVAPDMPQLQLTDASEQLNLGNWMGVEGILLPLLEQNTALADDVNRMYGTFLNRVGRPTEASRYLLRSKRLNPLNPGIAQQLGVAYMGMGQTAEAVAEVDWGISFNNAALNTFLLGEKMFAAYIDGDNSRAAEWVRAGGAPPGALYVEVADLLAAGDKAAALAAIRAGLRDDMSALEKVALATPASLAGDPALGFEMFRGASGGNAVSFGQIPVWTSLFHDIRQLPEFHELVVRAGLFDYWRTSGNWAEVCRPVGESDFACD